MIKKLILFLLIVLIISCGQQEFDKNQQTFAVYESSQSRVYPSARTGGNYMHNYYIPPAGTSTPWWPSWSPDGKWLTFSMQGSIWKIQVDDSTAYELANSHEYLSSPEWSPNGKYIVFTADDDSKTINLKLLDLETNVITTLSDGNYVNLDPAWSPNGKKLAYVSTKPNGYFNIFVMDIREGKPGKIIQLTKDNKFGKSRLYFGNNDLHIQPTWTPDGKSIIFVSNRGILLGSGAIWKMPAIENGIEYAQMIHLEETLYRTRPNVSLDGKRFIYSSHLGGQFNNLFVLPTVGGEPYKMTFGEWDHFSPRWSPNGEWIAYISNKSGLSNLHLLKTYGGTDNQVKIKSCVWKNPVGIVKVKIVDSETNDVLPARIYSKASDGKAYVPSNAYHRLSKRNRHFFHTSDEFTLEVPEGELTIEANHGFEYYPVAQKIQVESNNTTSVEIRMSRMSNLSEEGWYSSDSHMHMNYGGNLHNTPENMLSMAEAEDLNISNILVANKDNRVLDYQYFTGQLHPLSSEKHLLYFSEEYRPPFYGHISLLNLKKQLISPFTTGYEGTAIESLYPSNTDIFKFAKQQGALGGYVHPFSGGRDPVKGSLGGAKGFPVDLALGVLDYHEIVSWVSWAGYLVWHHALNNGFRIPVVAGEDAISDLHNNWIVGQTRTYAYMGKNLSWDGWINAIRKGNMFVTNGPLLKFEINDKIPGDEIKLLEDGGNVKANILIQSIVPLDSAELVINGKKLNLGDLTQHRDPNGPGTYLKLEKELVFKHGSWVTLQTYSTRPIHPVEDSFVQATTNPIWIMVGDKPVRSAKSAEYFIGWIDKLTRMAEAHPGWRSEKEKTHVFGQFQEARDVYKKLLLEAEELGL